MKLKPFLLGLGIILSIGHSFAQKNEDDKSVFLDAEYFLLSEDYSDALPAYLQLLKKDKGNGNLNYRIGLCLLNINGRKTEAIEYLENASTKISNKYIESHFNESYAPPQVLFLLGTAYQINNQFDEATSAFNEYKNHLNLKDVYEIDFVDKQIRSIETARKYMSEPLRLNSRSLEDLIPPRAANFNPVLSADGNTLIYVYSLKFYLAVYMIQKKDGQWTSRVNITPQLMSDGDCFPTSITGDGKTLYLIKETNFESDIYLSRFENGLWTAIEKLDKPINSNNVESHAGISADGNTMYFTSNRKNGMGGLDIYRSIKDSKGKWGEPENLGSTINTIYNEHTPFILPDNKTLFFSSQGHDGMGGFDTYKSVYQGENGWSVPQNLGYPWNTTDDNTFLYPIENGEKALYAGIIDKNERQASIKELSLSAAEHTRNEKIELKGVISLQDNAITDDNLILEIRNPDGKELEISPVIADINTGEFSIFLKPGKYTLTAKSENHTSRSETVIISDDYNRSEFVVNFDLIQNDVSSGDYVIIKNVFFDYDNYKLNNAAQLEIERLSIIMEQYPELQIEIIGHSDSKGNADYNFELSSKRAKSVVNYLVNNGISPSRLVNKGVGELDNIAINQNPDGSDNPEGRKQNRNVSIKILSSATKNIVIEPIQVPDYLKPKSKSIYTILLLKSDKAIDNSYFKDINSIITEGVEESSNQFNYVYSFGKFYSIRQAEELLDSKFLIKFPEAKIVNSDSLEVLLENTSQIAGLSSFNLGIQVHAFKNPDNAKRIKNLSDYRVYKCNDGYYRIVFGNYKNREEALEGLDYMRANGYKDAFIVDYQLLNKVGIKQR
ncbi:MAG: OmpA family protein [Bacteroidales bacterium]|nr:OmpA family protein [Bacteroidales bacterium]MCF8391343.1 OmpA family protein [Bacteroidales bacterium]